MTERSVDRNHTDGETKRNDETAVALLLRSPHLDVGQIMELMDIGDREFREMVGRNETIARRLEERRLGTLREPKSDPRPCKACGEWFLPYGSDRFCSDGCKRTAQVTACRRRAVS